MPLLYFEHLPLQRSLHGPATGFTFTHNYHMRVSTRLFKTRKNNQKTLEHNPKQNTFHKAYDQRRSLSQTFIKSQTTAQNKPTALHQQQTKQQHRNCRAVSNHQQTPAKEKLQPIAYRFDVSQHIQNHRSSCSENPSVQSFSLERVRVDPYSALHLLNSSHRSVRASLHNPKSTHSSIHEQDFFVN